MELIVKLNETEIKSAIYETLTQQGFRVDITKIRFNIVNDERDRTTYVNASAECHLKKEDR